MPNIECIRLRIEKLAFFCWFFVYSFSDTKHVLYLELVINELRTLKIMHFLNWETEKKKLRICVSCASFLLVSNLRSFWSRLFFSLSVKCTYAILNCVSFESLSNQSNRENLKMKFWETGVERIWKKPKISIQNFEMYLTKL